MNARKIMKWFKTRQANIRSNNYTLYRIIRTGGGGIVHYLHRKIADEKHENPTEEMHESRRFFDSNADRVQVVMNLLEDDESKLIYKTMIEYRCTEDYKLFKRIKEVRESAQYFDNDFFEYHDEETLIDGGAYDGDTIDMFNHQMKKRKIKNTKVIAFEPDESNYTRLVKRKAIVIKAGLWSYDGVLKFVEGKESFSRILRDGEELKEGEKLTEVKVRCIDGAKECNDATLIKMDIEGAEMEALKGAEKLIRTKKPKPAICIYHSNDDMIRIPEWIHNVVPEYRLWIRQHADTKGETVIYAML